MKANNNIITLHEPTLITPERSGPIPNISEDSQRVAIRNGDFSGMKFAEAFKMARDSKLKIFKWNNKSYTTEVLGSKLEPTKSVLKKPITYKADAPLERVKNLNSDVLNSIVIDPHTKNAKSKVSDVITYTGKLMQGADYDTMPVTLRPEINTYLAELYKRAGVLNPYKMPKRAKA